MQHTGELAPGAHEKALKINLDAERYGAFAEIGAGQEVARWFFHVGKASATIAKSISAYDMVVSDSLYGPAEHYVSRLRLEAMLDREYGRTVERLGPVRGDRTRFFAFADTVATNSSRRRHAGHGWLGLRFQPQPGAPPSDVIVHVQVLDSLAVNQQEAIGLVGVNLLYGAFYHMDDPSLLIGTLMDGLDRRRLEVDMIKFSGPAFQGVDNRLMSLQLVEGGLTDAVMFNDKGEVVQPAEVLFQRRVVMERGSFRPVTNVTREMLDRALQQLQDESKTANPVVLMEMTLNNLMSGRSIDHEDFLARVDMLGALGYMVMVSNYATFDRVTQYLRNYTSDHIGMVVGIPTLRQILEEKYYQDLEGGLLEGLGRLFSGFVRLLVYPTIETASGTVTTVETVDVPPNLKSLYSHLRENGFIEGIRSFETSHLQVSPADVLAKIQAGDPAWESMVPSEVVSMIAERNLFGYTGAGSASPRPE